MSSISQGADVKRQPRPDCQASAETHNQSLARSLTTSLRLQDRPLQGPNARRHRRAGRLPPLRFAALQARPLAWRARASRVPGRRQQNSPSTIDTLSMRHSPNRPGDPPHLTAHAAKSGFGFPHRPASNHGKGRSGTARVKSACGVASDRASSTLDPHRTEPKVGSYRGDAGGLPAR
jgi:hypothetical protein